MANKEQIEKLSQELARISGLRLRVPKRGDPGYTEPGFLRSLVPDEFFHWYKCPFHGTWLQPEFEPYPHWQCQAKDFCKEPHQAPSGSRRGTETETGKQYMSHIKCQGHKCTFAKPAKFRQEIEKRIFRVARFLEENA